MKNFCFSVLAALLVSGCTISGVSSKDKATTYYTQHSFYYEKGRYITTNYARGGVVSVNTMVKITNIGRNSMELELKDGTPLTVVNVKGFTLQDINGIRGRLLGEKPVILSGSGAGMQKAIKSGERDVPDYIEADHNKMVAKFVRAPGLSDVPFAMQMEPNLVVEFYSR